MELPEKYRIYLFELHDIVSKKIPVVEVILFTQTLSNHFETPGGVKNPFSIV